MLISYIETAESTESTEGSQRAVPNHKRNVLTVLKWYLLYLIWDTYKLVLQGQYDDIQESAILKGYKCKSVVNQKNCPKI